MIPLITALLQARTPLYAVMAFWISSPIMSPDMYILTAGMLGFGFANAKLLSAIFMGLFSGFLTFAFEKSGAFKNALNPHLAANMLDVNGIGSSISPTWKFWKEPARVRIFKDEFKASAPLILKWLFLAFVLESLMMAYVPADFIKNVVGVNSLLSAPLAVAIGIPAYLNGLAAVPLIKALIGLGMDQGAALAFLVGGSVTSIPAMMAVAALVRGRVFLWYLLLGIASSIAVGYAFQLYLNAF